MDPYVSATPVGSQNPYLGGGSPSVLNIQPVPTPSGSSGTVSTSNAAQTNLNGIKGNTAAITGSVASQAQLKAVGAQNQAQYNQIVAQSQQANQTAADTASKTASATGDQTAAIKAATQAVISGQTDSQGNKLNSAGQALAPNGNVIQTYNADGTITDQYGNVFKNGTLVPGISGNGNFGTQSNGSVLSPGTFNVNNPNMGVAPGGSTTGNSTTGQTGSTGSTGANTSDFNSQIEANMSASDKALADFQNAIGQIQNGTFPLTPSQNALLSSTQTLFQQAIGAQQLANQNLQGGVTSNNIATGLQRYAPNAATSNLSAAIQQGNAAIAKLDAQASQSLATLNEGFMKDDTASITDSYDALTKALDDKTAELQKMQDAATAAAKDARDFIQTSVTTPINNIATEAAKNNAPKSVQDAISAATSVQGAITAAGDWLQTGTGQVGDYLQYKRDAIAAGKAPEDYMTFKNTEDEKAAQIDIQKASAIAYATAAAKANADAASGVLSTQQNTNINDAINKLTGSQNYKDMSNTLSALNSIKGIPVDTTDPVQQKTLLFALARALVPTATSVRGALGALDPNGVNSDAYNLMKSAQGIFDRSGKAKLSPDAVSSIVQQINNAYTSSKGVYQTQRQNAIDALKARGIPNADTYIPDDSNLGDMSTADKLNAINSSVLSWKASAPASDVQTVNNAATKVAQARGVPVSSLTASDYQDIIQGSQGLKTKYNAPF